MDDPERVPADALTPVELASRLDAAVSDFRARRLDAARSACEAVLETAAASPQLYGSSIPVEARYWAARCARRQERPDDALRLLYAGLDAARQASEGRFECLMQAELVRLLSALGLNEDALEQADAALQRAATLRDPVGQAAAREALANIYWLTDDWVLGLKAYEQALALACACGHLELRVLCTLGMAATTEGVAQLATEDGRLEEANAGIRRSVQLQRDSGVLATQLGDDYLVMYSELNTACSLHSLGALDEAEEVLQRCVDDPSRASIHGNAMTILGRIAIDRGQRHAALGHLQRALPITERMNKPFAMLVVLEQLAHVHESLGDAASALGFLRRHQALYVRNASDKARTRALAMGVKYETERAQSVAELQRERADRLERSNHDLTDEVAMHARAALVDGLTGVANRRRFDQALAAAMQAGSVACSVAMIDLDEFKHINDTFSHQVGDEVLRRVAAVLQANCRRDDLVARYGGEEFVLLASAAGRDEMQAVCARIRLAVANENWSALRPGLAVTVSIGLAHGEEISVHDAGEALLALADRRLYGAKQGGRNLVCDSGLV